MYTLGAGRILIKSNIIVCLLNLKAWKAGCAHRTGENEKKGNDKIKKSVQTSSACDFAGWFATIVDICENTTFTSEKTIHLTTDGKAKGFEKCECSLKGRFLVALADVRLRSASHPNHCSPAQLLVNFKTYQCDQMTNTDGSVFNKTSSGALTDDVISYTTNSETEEPEMIYFTAKPEGKYT